MIPCTPIAVNILTIRGLACSNRGPEAGAEHHNAWSHKREEITKLYTVFDVYDNEITAIRSFA